jgi:hypothetical protein
LAVAALQEEMVERERKRGALLVAVHDRFDLEEVVAAYNGYRKGAGGRGRPAQYTVRQLCWLVVARVLLNLSLRQMAERVRQDRLVCWFCGFGLDEPTPSYVRLHDFELYVRREGGHRLFYTILEQICADFPDDCAKPQIGDTFALQSRCVEVNRTVRLRQASSELLRCLAQASPTDHAAVVAGLEASGDWVRLFGEPEEVRDELLPTAERNPRECRTAHGATALLAAVRRTIEQAELPLSCFATPAQLQAERHPLLPGTYLAGDTPDSREHQQRQRLNTWPELLDKLLSDEFMPAPPAPESAPESASETAPETASETASESAPVITEGAAPALVHRKGAQGTLTARGPYALLTVADTQATLRIHGQSQVLGYNVGVLATDTFVYGVVACTGARPDGDMPALLLTEQCQRRNFAPTRLIFDRAAGTPKRFAQVAQVTAGQTQLVARLTRRHQTVKQRACFGPDDYGFQIQADGSTALVCPNGQATQRAIRQNRLQVWRYQFDAAQCGGIPLKGNSAPPPPSCPLWEKCYGVGTTPKQARTVAVSDYAFYRQSALAYLPTAACRSDLLYRCNIERVIAGLTRYNGARRARSYGLPAADFQVRLATVAYNLKRWHTLHQHRQHRRPRQYHQYHQYHQCT